MAESGNAADISSAQLMRQSPLSGVSAVVPQPPRTRHLGDTADLVRASLLAGLPALLFAGIIVGMLGGSQVLGPIRAGAILIGVPLVAILTVLGFSRLTAGLFGRDWRGGGKPMTRAFSMEEAAIAQGRTADAERMYRNAIFADPNSREARLRLAALLIDGRRDLDEAELLYQEVRHLDPNPSEEVAVFNGLLDLYQMTGRKVDFDAELRRFTERFGSAVGVPGARPPR
jgi:hypothetical protein